MIRSRSSTSESASSSSIAGSVVGSNWQEAGEQPALVGVGADDERHPVRGAVAHRLRRGSVGRYSVPKVGPTTNAPRISVMPRRDHLVQRVDQLRGPGRHQRGRAVLARRRPSSVDEVVGEGRGDVGRPGPCRWPGSPKSPARTGPSAAGTASSVATACAPALSPKIVTLSGSPPNTAMLSRTHRSAMHQIAQEQVVRRSDARASTATTGPGSRAHRAGSSPRRRRSRAAPGRRRRRSGSPSCPGCSRRRG